MKCTDRWDDSILRAASRQLALPQRLAVALHTASCGACRARRDEYRRIWRSLAAAGPNPAPARSQTAKGARAFALSVVVAIAIGAAFAQHEMTMPFKCEISSSNSFYKITANYPCRMIVKDSRGVVLGRTSNDIGDPARGRAYVHVTAGAGSGDFEFSGYGVHALRAQNRRIGALIIAPYAGRTYNVRTLPRLLALLMRQGMPREQVDAMQAEWNGRGSGIDTEPYGARGGDRSLRFTWKMRGYARIVVKTKSGISTADCLAPPLAMARILPRDLVASESEQKTPRLEILVDGLRSEYAGYGAHDVRDSDGRRVATVSVARLPGAQTERR